MIAGNETYYRSFVVEDPYFKKLLESYTAEWESIGNTNKRLAFHASAALEEKLPTLASRMGDRKEDLQDVVAAAKVFKDLAGIAPRHRALACRLSGSASTSTSARGRSRSRPISRRH
jgi:hypothetical protein